MPPSPRTRETAPPRDFLVECLREWPVSLALLRATEMRKLWRYPLTAPTLDVGCGDGYFTSCVLETPLEAGIDLKPEAVARALAQGVYRQAIVGNVCRMPFADRSFASVFSNCVLEHIDGIDEAMAEVGRVLKPGGTFLATVATPRWETDGPIPLFRRWGWNALSDRLNVSLRKSWHHVNLLERDGWSAVLAKGKMKMQVWEPYMAPVAYEDFARYLPTAVFSNFLKRVLGRNVISRSLRRAYAPVLARRFRASYAAESEKGNLGLFVAVKE